MNKPPFFELYEHLNSESSCLYVLFTGRDRHHIDRVDAHPIATLMAATVICYNLQGGSHELCSPKYQPEQWQRVMDHVPEQFKLIDSSDRRRASQKGGVLATSYRNLMEKWAVPFGL